MVCFHIIIIDQEFKKLVKPLVKHVRLHLIDANDLMKVQYNDCAFGGKFIFNSFFLDCSALGYI